MSAVFTIQYAAGRAGIPAAQSIRVWARTALAGNSASRSRRTASAVVKRCTIRIVGRVEGRQLNRDYRQRDYATNVLAFPYGDGSGDLVVCAPVVAAEARAAGKPLRAHYAHLIIHGMLHLQGYDHLNDADADRMETRERTLLAQLGYPDPYGDD